MNVINRMKSAAFIPDIRKQPQTSSESLQKAVLGSAMNDH